MRSRSLDPDAARDAVRRLFAGLPTTTAVMTASMWLTVGVLRTVPDDVAVVGFDEFLLPDLMRRQITAVVQPVKELGRQAVRLLLETMSDPDLTRQLVLPTRLVVRGGGARLTRPIDLGRSGKHLTAVLTRISFVRHLKPLRPCLGGTSWDYRGKCRSLVGCNAAARRSLTVVEGTATATSSAVCQLGVRAAKVQPAGRPSFHVPTDRLVLEWSSLLCRLERSWDHLI